MLKSANFDTSNRFIGRTKLLFRLGVLKAYIWASVTNWAFIWINHMDFKNFYKTIYSWQYKSNTGNVCES